MVAFPNCKINLGLNIVSKRTDGYHDIESVFYPVPWVDFLEIIPAPLPLFKFDGIKFNCPENENLCSKAYYLLKSIYKLPEISLFLYKNIPMGAGLGGGSSDAAFTISLLNSLFSLNNDEKILTEIASQIGSDCAFFIHNKPGYICGTGSEYSPVSLSLKGYQIFIIKPEISVSTREAYSIIKPQKPEININEIIKLPVKEWKNLLVNDFEEPVFKIFPEIKILKDTLYEQGAVYASMSGSGSAVYGLFESDTHINFSFPNCICWKGVLD